jgi:peptide/nickel transport system permease protein
MLAYFLRRLFALIPTFLFASIIVFSAVRLIPGDVVDMMLSQNDIGANRKTKDQLIQALGLDQPMHLQYLRWLSAIVTRLDLGTSLWTQQTVTSLIFERLPTTLYLGTLAISFALLIAIPIGILSAVRQDTAADYIGRSIAITALAVPVFWVGTMVVVFPSIWWGVAPTTRYVAFFVDPWLSFKQMAIPALVLGIALSGITMRMTRTMVLEVLRQDYIRTAWAKGLDEGTIIRRHVMKNALLPVITIIGLQVPLVLGGAVIVEQIFVLPGMGQLLLEAVSQRDYPLITGIFLFVGSGVLLINLVVDLSYGLLDPKIRQG